ncbi:hypothetical protein [Confluentibacter sediminis]|uniref:hypothetical protein n=1 Tax=Confluentibacter sediminis TaxID=2219045 RepID=UPI000DAD7086|nr:hypothetical protein [Confluentibacter sediminis]
MKKPFLLLLFISTLGFSQEKFIEVLVKDTIVLKPISFEYTIKSDIGFDFEETNRKNRTDLIKESDKKVLDFLNNGNYKFEEIQMNTLLAGLMASQPKSYTVFIPDLNSKERFIESIEKTGGLEYFLTNTNYEQNELTEERIYLKLLEKADQRAQLLGKVKNLKIGDIIEISETKASETVFSNFMGKLMERGDSALDVTTTFLNDNGVLRKSISVKYKVE